MDQTKNLYAFPTMRSSQREISWEDGTTIAHLMDLENRLGAGDVLIEQFAEEVLKVFATTGQGLEVDRVCLAILTPYSQRLTVMSSANSQNLPITNEMSPGYSCYVATDSSVFRTEDRSMRICSDLEDFMQRFRGKQTPPQRSLAKLHKMSLRSSLTRNLNAGPLGKGYLFLNSRKAKMFDQLRNSDYFGLGVLKLIASNLFMQKLFGFYQLQPRLEELLREDLEYGSVFEADRFANDFRDALSEMGALQKNLKFKCNITQEFFYPSATALLLASEILTSIFSPLPEEPLYVELGLNENSTQASLKITSEYLHRSRSSNIWSNLIPLLGFEAKIDDRSFVLSTSFEPAKFDKYSV